MPRRALVFTALGVVFLLMALSLRADMRITPHNLARQGAALAKADETNELCVFCHTPTVPGDAVASPRWQRHVEATHVFPTYDDTGIVDLAKGRAGSHSVVCLSCHDAAQAATAGNAPDAAPTFTFDHPIGVPYRGATEEPHSVLLPREYHPASRGTVGGREVWWVSRRGPGLPRGRDDLPFFSGPAPAGGESVPLIECGTCHDPHSPNRLFLRVTAAGSALCLTCHNK